MNTTFKNILKTFASNIVSLVSGVLVGFIVPKMMGLEDYANYKIYTLYLTYLAIFSLGLGDGLYLKFSGVDKEKLNQDTISYYLHKYYLQLLLIFVPTLVISLFFVEGDYKFIICALSFTLLSSQVTAVHQNLSVLTSRFNEYSFRVIVKSILTIAFVGALFLLYHFNGSIISYKIYTVGVIAIEFLLALWYVFSYRDFNFHKSTFTPQKGERYIDLLFLGFPLLISNMAGSIFLNLDRQFVSVLFSKDEYAIYAFAYNMLTLITTMTSAVSLVLFPSLRQKKNLDVKSNIENYGIAFALFIAASLLVYFVLYLFVPWFLPKYTSSLEIFRIVLPGIMWSSFVSVIFINFYKYDNKVVSYFFKTALLIVISGILNYLAYYFFNSYVYISWASILTLILWFLVVQYYFVKKYQIKWRKTLLYLLIIMVAFYLCTFLIQNIFISGTAYAFSYLAISFAFYHNEIVEKIKSVKKK